MILRNVVQISTLFYDSLKSCPNIHPSIWILEKLSEYSPLHAALKSCPNILPCISVYDSLLNMVLWYDSVYRYMHHWLLKEIKFWNTSQNVKSCFFHPKMHPKYNSTNKKLVSNYLRYIETFSAATFIYDYIIIIIICLLKTCLFFLLV